MCVRCGGSSAASVRGRGGRALLRENGACRRATMAAARWRWAASPGSSDTGSLDARSRPSPSRRTRHLSRSLEAAGLAATGSERCTGCTSCHRHWSTAPVGTSCWPRPPGESRRSRTARYCWSSTTCRTSVTARTTESPCSTTSVSTATRTARADPGNPLVPPDLLASVQSQRPAGGTAVGGRREGAALRLRCWIHPLYLARSEMTY